MPFLIDLREHAAEGDLSDTRYIGITLVGSVATMVDVHSILSGLEADADTDHAEAPNHMTALSVAALRLLREALESDLLVAARLQSLHGEADPPAADTEPAGESEPPRPAARAKKEAG